MFTDEQKKLILESIIEKIELPDYAYETATKRYEDLGKWFSRDESSLKNLSPHIFPQGSFRLGTAIRPIDESESYDLDLGCELENGVTMDNCTQKELKTSYIKQELETYRKARGIKNDLEEKHRCWRLEYLDELNFHMDIVPCIPSDIKMNRTVFEAIMRNGEEEKFASILSKYTVRITDNRHPNYDDISELWPISNPIGYAKWFENRMFQILVKKMITDSYRAKLDEVPEFPRKYILQRVVQILKRHRDVMFRDTTTSDLKPISIIITTLAAKAYSGEENISDALNNVLTKMRSMINSQFPKVPNPVNPAEDFADRWKTDPKLEKYFNFWLIQALTDFGSIVEYKNADKISDLAKIKLSISLDPADLKKNLGVMNSGTIRVNTPYTILNPHKPWGYR